MKRTLPVGLALVLLVLSPGGHAQPKPQEQGEKPLVLNQRRLQKVLERATIHQIAFGEVLELLADFSRVAFKADWAGLKAAGLTPTTKVSSDFRRIPVHVWFKLLMWELTGGKAAALVSADGVHLLAADEAARRRSQQPEKWLPLPRDTDPVKAADRRLARFHRLRHRNTRTAKWRLAEWFQFFREIADCSVFVDWPRLKAEGISPDVQPDITFRGEISPCRALVALQRHFGARKLTWGINDYGMVIVSTPAGVERLAPNGMHYPSLAGYHSLPLDKLPPIEADLELHRRTAPKVKGSFGRYAERRLPISDALQVLRDRGVRPMLVDWEALAKAGVRPDTVVTMSSGPNRLVRDVLASLLGQVGAGEVMWGVTAKEDFVISTKAEIGKRAHRLAAWVLSPYPPPISVPAAPAAPKPPAPARPEPAASRPAATAPARTPEAERRAQSRLRVARGFLQNRMTDKARAILTEIVRKYPGTEAARQAKAELEAIQAAGAPR